MIETLEISLQIIACGIGFILGAILAEWMIKQYYKRF